MAYYLDERRDTSVNERDPHPQASLSILKSGWEGKGGIGMSG